MLRTKVNPADKRLFLRRQNVAPMPHHRCNGPAECMMHRELSFAFRVSIYQLLVFWLPGGLIAAGLVAYGFRRFRTELFRREFNFRREIVGDLHDNLSSRLYALRILSSQVANPAASAEKQQERTTRLSELALDCMQVIGNIIWSFDPNHNSLDTLVAKVNNFTEKAISPLVPVELNMLNPKKMQTKVIRPQTNHLLLMIFQELLTNIIKHTESIKIRIDIYSKEDQLVVNIQNYFEKPPTTTLTKPQDADEHYGLDNLSSRLLKIRGELDFNQTSNAQYFYLMIPMKT
ncbi:GHKL domain-containing protein [Haliscomenobacter sp.]|uniref:sensor histidine kinase n=1 Tax=Haliscomenobacter sp. TaxID=2717303 RepID=UPI003364D792